jgi:hypothetical protein
VPIEVLLGYWAAFLALERLLHVWRGRVLLTVVRCHPHGCVCIGPLVASLGIRSIIWAW